MNRREFLGLTAVALLGSPKAFAAPPPLQAIVTCDLEATLAVVDVRAGRLLHKLACTPDPRSIERAGTTAVVCHTSVGAVSLVDLAAMGIRRVLHDFVEPRYTAAHPDGRHAFVTDSGSQEVVSVDLLAGRTLGRLKLPDWARHLTLAPDARTLWIGLGNLAERVAIVDVSDPVRPRRTRVFRPPFFAHDVGFEPGGHSIWVTAGQAGTTAIYDSSGVASKRLSEDPGPQHVSFGSGLAYVTSGAAGTFRVVELPRAHELRLTRIPVGSYNVQAGHGLVLTPSLNTGVLSVLDSRGELRSQVHVSASSHDACFAT